MYRRGVHSARDVRERLRRAGASSESAAQVVAECRSRGLVDDAACARLWADHWSRRGYAWSVIRVKLSEKGLEAQVIEQAADRLGTAVQDETRVRQAVEASAERSARLPAEQQVSQLTRRLASRGFDSELIERVLSETFGPRGV